jgi:hypothetical protein
VTVSYLRLGVTYASMPIPIEPSSTRFVPAGAVTFGLARRQVDLDVGHRFFTQEEIDAALVANGHDPAAFAAAREAAGDGGDGGVTIHVLDGATGEEVLRFDCFDGDAHYHYIRPGVEHTIVPFDVAAGGDMATWAVERLEHHLPAMLAHAGSAELAARTDPAAVAGALAEVRELVDVYRRPTPAAAGERAR